MDEDILPHQCVGNNFHERHQDSFLLFREDLFYDLILAVILAFVFSKLGGYQKQEGRILVFFMISYHEYPWMINLLKE
jgi:hypothetical protein